MPKSRENSPRRRTIAVVSVAAAIAALSVALVAGVGGAGAAPSRTTVVLGSTATNPNPNCPKECRGIVSSTGFQVSTDQTKLPFKVPFDGEVTAWTLTLGQPTNSQRAYFNNIYGRPPQAHLAVLKRVPGTNPPVYRLRRQSPIKVLSPFLGSTVKFKLAKPLKVLKGDIIGLSVPTWAPGFSDGLSNDNKWRASRDADFCSAASASKGRPQQKLNSKREYGCTYETARLLYTATVVKGR